MNLASLTDSWERRFDVSSSIVVDGPLVFTMGQGGFDDQGNIVDPDDVYAQLRQAYRNLERALEPHGASLETVVKITLFFSEPGDFAAHQDVRREFFKPPFPASTAVVAGGFLIEGMRVEVEAVAAVGHVRGELGS